MNPRAFSFAALLASVAGPALAESPVAQEPTAQAPDTLPLAAKWKLDVKGGVLIAKLSFTNTSNAPVDVIVARGNGPGPYVTASVGGTALAAVLDRAQQADMVSRMGPMPKYGAILASQEFEAGTFRFKLPAGFKEGQAVHLQAYVSGPTGASSTFVLDMGGEPGV